MTFDNKFRGKKGKKKKKKKKVIFAGEQLSKDILLKEEQKRMDEFVPFFS